MARRPHDTTATTQDHSAMPGAGIAAAVAFAAVVTIVVFALLLPR